MVIVANQALKSLLQIEPVGQSLRDWVTFQPQTSQTLVTQDNVATAIEVKIELPDGASQAQLTPISTRLENGAVGFLLNVNSDQKSDQRDPLVGGYVIDFKEKTCRVNGQLADIYARDYPEQTIPLQDWLDLFQTVQIDQLKARLRRQPNQPTNLIQADLTMKDPNGSSQDYRHDIKVLEYGPSGQAIKLNALVHLTNRNFADKTLLEMDAVGAVGHNIWSRDLKTDRMTIRGPIVSRLGLGDGQIHLDRHEWNALIHPDDLKDALPRTDRNLYEQGSAEIVYRIKDQHGGFIRLRTKGAISEQSADGQPLKISGISTEIGEVEWYEEQFNRSKAHQAEAMFDAGISSWEFDTVHNRVSIEGPAIEQLGPDVPILELSFVDWNALLHKKDMAVLEFGKEEIIQTGSTTMEFELNPTGKPSFWVDMWGTVTERDSDGQPTRLSCFSSDITDRKSLESALAFEQERMNAIYRQTPAMMWSFDSDGRILMVSDYWSKKTNISSDEALNRPFCNFTHKDDEGICRDVILDQLFEDGQISRETIRLKTAQGDILETRMSAFVEDTQDGRRIAHSVCEDVTDLSRARKDIEAYADELERTNRELDRFATIASHDLQEPLRKIAAFASLLKRRYEGQLDVEADQSLDYLMDAAGRMRNLIDDLLTYSRTSSRTLEHKTIDLNRALKEVTSALGVSIEEAEARIHIPSLPEILGDQTLISLLFQNLLSNAIKYRRKDTPPVITISTEAIGRDWRFKIEDNGIGMEDRFKEKIFAPFQRLHSREDFDGTGIGLAICQQVVERHGGRIWVETQPGIGSQFFFTLPRQVEKIAVA